VVKDLCFDGDEVFTRTKRKHMLILYGIWLLEYAACLTVLEKFLTPTSQENRESCMAAGVGELSVSFI
jgi:hypothetical protein